MLPDPSPGVPAGTEVIQVRAALLGLLVSIAVNSAIPLFAVMLTVVVFAIYSNGEVEADTVTGGTS